MTTVAEIINSARLADAANAGVVNLLSRIPELERLVMVWPNFAMPPDPDLAEECPPDLPVAVHLRWVWSRLQPDPVPEWIALAGLPDAPHVRRAVQLAIDNRIVLPDGSMSSWAQAYVQQQARRVLGLSREAPAPEQDDEEETVEEEAT